MERGRFVFLPFRRAGVVICLAMSIAPVIAGAAKVNNNAAKVDWVERFSIWHNHNGNRALSECNSATLAWFESPLLRSYLYLFHATGDTSWLEQFVLHADSVLKMMKDFPEGESCWSGYRDGFSGWGTTVYDTNGFYQEYLVHDAVICLPLARFVRMVYETPELWNRFGERAQLYQVTVENEVIGKWFFNWDARRGSGEDLEHYGGWHGLPFNQFLAFGELLLIFEGIRRSPHWTGGRVFIPDWFYHLTPDSFARFYFANLVFDLRNDCFVWKHQVTGTRYEDISHANLDVSFALESAEDGGLFRSEDLKRLARTFERLVCDRSGTRLALRRFVNGSGESDSVGALEGWLGLARYGPGIIRAGAEFIARVPAERMNVSMAASCARLALTGPGGDKNNEVNTLPGAQGEEVPGALAKGGLDCPQAIFDVIGRRCAGTGILSHGIYFVRAGRFEKVLLLH